MGFECRDLVDFFEVTDLVNATFSKVRLWQLWADHVQSKIVKGYQQRSQTARNSLFFMFFFSSVSRDFFLIFLIFSWSEWNRKNLGLVQRFVATLEVWSKLVSRHLISRRSIMAIVRLVCWDVEEVSFDKFQTVSQVQEKFKKFHEFKEFQFRMYMGAT